jgi:hypothetical protein
MRRASWLIPMSLVACVSANTTAAATTDSKPPRAPMPRPILADIGQIAVLDLAQGVTAYQSRDAAWVPGQPLAVNADYDFAMALAIEGAGPGLAVAKRRQSSQALAQRFGALAPLDRDALLRVLCDAPPHTACARFAGRPLLIYGFVFGDREARLQVFVEAGAAREGEYPAVSVTDARAVEAFLEPGALQRAFEDELVSIAAILERASATTDASGTCKVGGRSSLQGRVIAETTDDVWMLVSEPREQRVVCPKNAFELEPAGRVDSATP